MGFPHPYSRLGSRQFTAVWVPPDQAEDEVVLALARSESRILLTEDKDFGLLTIGSGP
jgi:predicted nuclease of predicted toxin-antitoxin system